MSTEERREEEGQEEEGHKKELSWVKLIKENPAVITGIFALGAAVATGLLGLGVAVATGIFSVLEKNETGRQELELERIKFEYDLISEILSDKLLEEDFNQEVSSESLLFLAEIGVIKILDAEALANKAKSGEDLPRLPTPQTSWELSSSDLSEVQAYIRSCRQVLPVNGSVAIYDNSDLGTRPANRIGTIDVGMSMYLTGVVRYVDGGPSAAQIYMSNREFPKAQPVGWVDASLISECR